VKIRTTLEIKNLRRYKKRKMRTLSPPRKKEKKIKRKITQMKRKRKRSRKKKKKSQLKK
jgi:hypothetical protein